MLVVDTIYNDKISQFNIPSSLGLGVSYEIIDKLSFGLEFRTSSWDNSSGYFENPFKKAIHILSIRYDFYSS